MKTAFKIKFFVAFLFCLIFNALGSVAEISPEKPEWGQILTVTYDPQEKGATYTQKDELFIRISMRFENHDYKVISHKMKKKEGKFFFEQPIENKLALVSIYFFTQEKWDPHAPDGSVWTMIYRPDGQPARTAYENNRSFNENVEKFFKKEIEFYPDNYTVYRTKWFWETMNGEKMEGASVKKDMEKISSEVKSETAEYYFTMSYGFLLLREELESRKMIRKLTEKFPCSPLTTYAFDNYSYQSYAQHITGEGPEEMKKLLMEVIQKCSASPHAQDVFKRLAIYQREDFPLTKSEIVCGNWMEREPENPVPYYLMAKIYLNHKEKPEKAEELLERAITLLLKGNRRLYKDISGKRTERELPVAYRMLAEIHLLKKDYTYALSCVEAAHILDLTSNYKIFHLEGDVWKQLGNYKYAKKAYLEAWKRGSSESEQPLKELYLKKHGNLEGFKTFLSGERDKTSDPVQNNKLLPAFKKAPHFSAKSLAGREFNLSLLKGKVVVLNFWFLGCAPCKVEIPALNKLVNEFKVKKNVEFIAFALDPADTLKSYLKKKPFNYHIIPDSSEIFKKYGFSAAPVHVVIDKKGNTLVILHGALDIREKKGKGGNQLRLVIERALGE